MSWRKDELTKGWADERMSWRKNELTKGWAEMSYDHSTEASLSNHVTMGGGGGGVRRDLQDSPGDLSGQEPPWVPCGPVDNKKI